MLIIFLFRTLLLALCYKYFAYGLAKDCVLLFLKSIEWTRSHSVNKFWQGPKCVNHDWTNNKMCMVSSFHSIQWSVSYMNLHLTKEARHPLMKSLIYNICGIRRWLLITNICMECKGGSHSINSFISKYLLTCGSDLFLSQHKLDEKSFVRKVRFIQLLFLYIKSYHPPKKYNLQSKICWYSHI